ncbi:MAG: hypothetical protein ACLUKK_07170 [Lacrimispora saccharolytica]
MKKKEKRVIQKETASNTKIPKHLESPEGYLSKHPVWAFQRCDKEHPKWSITTCSLYGDIIEKLISFEGQTWAEIQAASGGKKSGTNHHFENISDLSRAAQKRISDLRLNIDQVFSLRLSGKVRLYGILEDGVFFILWYDPEHEIYPSHKRHT